MQGVPRHIQNTLIQQGDYDLLKSDVKEWLYEWNEAELNKEKLTRSAKENPMNKTAKMALRRPTANWGLTALSKICWQTKKWQITLRKWKP